MTSAVHTFLPWVRQGVLRGLTTLDTLGGGLATRATMPVRIRLRETTSDARVVDSEPIPFDWRLYGPGDVIGIDPREIIRTDPRHLTPDFPPHLFPTIEFVRADFPWLFTPAAPNGDKLRPWIVLIVVEKSAAELTVTPSRPLPMLQCAASQLPDLAESWLWAHAQFTGAAGEPVKFEQTVSRLICPRDLEPSGGTNTGYLACLVPAFDIGRKAGLGAAITAGDEAELKPAWDVMTGGKISLPVYYSWEFATAAREGDFEDLVGQLIPGVIAPKLNASKQPEAVVMDVSDPGYDLPRIQGATLGVPSALRVQSLTIPEWPESLESSPETSFKSFQDNLRRVLETPPGTVQLDATPAMVQPVPPPIYGLRQAKVSETDSSSPLSPTAPAWLRKLNLDPRFRVAAALGAQVVKQQQEQLVASAWRQAGELADVNRWLRQKQLAREVTRSVFEKRLKVLTPESLAQITAPAAAPIATSPSASNAVSQDALPVSSPLPSPLSQAIVSAPFRRIARPQSPLARRAAAPGAEQPALQLRDALGTMSAGFTASQNFTDPVETPGLKNPGGALSDAVVEPRLDELADAMAEESAATLSRLDPTVTFARERRARIRLPTPDTPTQPTGASMSDKPAAAPATTDRTDRQDPLAQLHLTPTFPQPMYEPLRDLFRDMLLPGLDELPNNTIRVLRAEPRFIEAYMVGLNDELNRELLWREFPTDLRGTYFRQFWDVRSQLGSVMSAADRESLYDIPPITDWDADLGFNMSSQRGRDLVFLLIKGDLLLRFPTALILAAPAIPNPDSSGAPVPPLVVDGSKQRLPSLQVDPAPGVRLLGFIIEGGDTTAAGDPGWFFIFQEYPTEPHFGLNVSRNTSLSSWRVLAWSDVAVRTGGARYISVGGKKLTFPGDTDTPAVWGRTAADMAYITLQKSYRVEVHAGAWLA